MSGWPALAVVLLTLLGLAGNLGNGAAIWRRWRWRGLLCSGAIFVALALLGYQVYDLGQTPGLAECVRCAGVWGTAHNEVNKAAVLYAVSGIVALGTVVWFLSATGTAAQNR